MSDATWQILDRLTIVFSILGMVGALYSAFQWWVHLRREKVMSQPIAIRLVDAANPGHLFYQLPYTPPRSIVTRSEIMGLLGMIPSADAGKRFEWAWLHTPEFMKHLDDINHGKRHSLDIPLIPAELAQVKLPQPSAAPANQSTA